MIAVPYFELSEIAGNDIASLVWRVGVVVIANTLVNWGEFQWIAIGILATLLLLFIKTNVFAFLLNNDFRSLNANIDAFGGTLKFYWRLRLYLLSCLGYSKNIFQQVFPELYVVLIFLASILPFSYKLLCSLLYI